MQSLFGKINYLHGLAEGIGVDENSKEGKIISGILDLLEEIVEELVDLREEQEELDDYIGSIDEDLYDLENDLYYDEEDDDYIEMKCPNCEENIFENNNEIEDEKK